ncbi:MAG: hypothetical protein WBP11_01925 [Dokdonella sp.]
MTTNDSSQDLFDATRLSLIERLKCFNAKERYWAVRQALGGFDPTPEFVQSAAKAAGFDPSIEPIRGTTFLAMDYHLNWLHAALSGRCLPCDEMKGTDMPKNQSTSDPSNENEESWDAVQNSIEDVDLLLAYEVPNGTATMTRIILIEAKCAGEFTKKQLASKLNRLALIVGSGQSSEPKRYEFDVRFVLMSPNPIPETLKKGVTGSALLGKNFRRSGQPGDSYLKLEIFPIDHRGFWMVQPRDELRVAGAPPPPLAANGSKQNKSRGWTHWSMSLRPKTAVKPDRR